MKRTPLTHARLLELLDYDPKTGAFTWRQKRQRFSQRGARAGTLNPSGYRHIIIEGRSYKEHRVAWFYVHGAWPTMRLDHENGHTSENWIDNLRPATHSQNLANAKLRKDNRAGFKGVCRSGARWMANINKDGRRQYLGLFDTPDAAHAAYTEAAARLFGEFARAA